MAQNDPRNFKTLREIARPDILFSVARLPNSSRLLVGSSDGKVLSIDAAEPKGTVKELANPKRYVTSLVLVGRTVISGSYDGKLIWWDVDREKVIRTLEGHTKQVRQLAASPNGAKVASVGDDMVCRMWNTASGELVRELHGHQELTPTHFTSMLYCCAFSPDGKHLATGDRVGHVVLWDAVTGKQLAALETPTLYTWDAVQRIRSIGGVRALAFSPDGAHLAIGGVGQIKNVDGLGGPSRVEVFDWQRRERVYEFTGAQGLVNRLIYQPNNQWLCALGGGNNGLVIFHDPKTRAVIHQGNMPMFVHDAVFNEDQTTLFAVGHQKIAVMGLAAEGAKK
jgi:WD40 repeat protein